MSIASDAADLGPWFHNLHLPDEAGGTVQTISEHPFGDFPRFKWDQIAPHLPADLTGKTALDIGCNAGFYSFELARRGASVLGVDLNEHYLKQAEFARGAMGFDAHVDFRRLSVYDLSTLGSTFDVVLFMGVFYHLRYPLLGLDVVSKALNPDGGRLVFQTLTSGGEEVAANTAGLNFGGRDRLSEPGWPGMAFFEHGFNADCTNWWAANHAGVEAMLRSTGLRVTARPGHEIYLCDPAPELATGAKNLRDAEYRSALGLGLKR